MEKKHFTFRLDSKKYNDGLKESLEILKENNINLSAFMRNAIVKEAARLKGDTK